MICHIYSSEMFFVHPLQDQTENFAKVQQELEKMEGHLEKVNMDTVREDTVCVLRQGDAMYRAVVTSSRSPGSSLSLILLDFGTPVFDLSNAELLVMPDVGWLCDLPGLAVPCKLADVPPLTSENLTVSKQILERLLKSPNLVYNAILITKGAINEIVFFWEETTLNEEMVDFFNFQCHQETDHEDVARAEVTEGWNPMDDDYEDLTNNYKTNDNDLQVATDGYRSKRNICPFFANSGRCYKGQFCEDIHDLPRPGAVTTDVEEIFIDTLEQQSWPRIGDIVLVKVVWIQSPGFFYIIFPYGPRNVSEITEEARKSPPEETAWTRMEAEMKELYKNTRKYFMDCLPSPGELVAVKTDGGWQRAYVTMELSDVSVEVFFVDKGDRKTELLKNLRLLDPRFTSLPHQVYEACLDGLEPTGSTWTKKSGLLMESLLTYGDYNTAKIMGSSGDKLRVELASVVEDTTADISSVLCEFNVALKVEVKTSSTISSHVPG